ncbi:MAG TPA: PAS domain S-box protein [Methylomirabilota bacterium]|nr:PAS domain S-box protein [Methylomirabilota bacterium]
MAPLDDSPPPEVTDDRQAFPSTLPAGRTQRRVALVVILASAVLFLAAVPFARTPLAPVWAFIPAYESALVANDLITAFLLFGQAAFLGSPGLMVLAAGYGFTAAIAACHALTFPGLFAPGGLLGAGPQSTAWLYMFWHAGFPLFVVGYAWLKGARRTERPTAVMATVIAGTAVLVGGLALLGTAGHDLLPAIMAGDHYAPAMTAVVTSTWVLSVLAVAVLGRRRPHSVVDIWLIVVMWAWVLDVALSAVLNAGRFDLGFYAGRVYGLLAASFVLLALLVENGKLYGRLVEAHTRTRRLSRERELDNQRRVTAIVDSSDDAIIGKDLDGVITSWNAAAERMFGYLAQEAIGRPIALIVPPDRRQEEDDVLARLRRGERIDHFETVRGTRDGRLIDVALTISPLRDAAGRVFGAATIGRDLTDRKRAQEALRQSEATALAFITSAAEGILIVDEAGRIVIANAQVEKIFGYRQAELLGQPVEMLLPERLRGRHLGHRADYLADPRVRPMGRGLDLAGRRRDGSEFPVEISLSYVRTGEGTRVMAFVTDITERLLRERAARQSEKLAALGTLSAGLAHELNNPLGIIGTRIELMLMEGEDEPLSATVREDLGVIQRQVQRVIRLVKSLLSYARPSESERRPLDLNEVVDEMMLLTHKQLSKSGVQITTALERSLPPIVGERSALEQMLLNLITNAHQALGETGAIRIVTRATPGRPGWVDLVVSDTGPGIPPDLLSRIFDPYFSTKATGTGLGLSITNRIVEDHGGTIQVNSRPGEGAEFVLSFPAETPATG